MKIGNKEVAQRIALHQRRAEEAAEWKRRAVAAELEALKSPTAETIAEFFKRQADYQQYVGTSAISSASQSWARGYRRCANDHAYCERIAAFWREALELRDMRQAHIEPGEPPFTGGVGKPWVFHLEHADYWRERDARLVR